MVSLLAQISVIDSLIHSLPAWAGGGGGAPSGPPQEVDACQGLFRFSATQLRQSLDFRLMRDFPVEAQLEEGNARLSPLSILMVDCERQRLVVSGLYEFRSNLGVMDITRRGTLVLQLQLTPQPARSQVLLEQPHVQDITFDNPAPWFDGKAISNWAVALFAAITCARLDTGLPC